MKFYFSDRQLAHQPRQYMIHGKLVQAYENNDRATTLLTALDEAGLARVEATPGGHDAIFRVHADHFVEFLRVAHGEFTALPNAGDEVLPNIHPYRGADAAYTAREKPRPTGIIGRAGWYVGDLSAVIMAGTYEASIASAETAISAARAVLAGDSASFALCRPPGHHAYVDRASGFCFLNNAAIAAEVLREQFGRVAILDFDTHHGDGTQAIFYSRNDVYFGSVHTDPSAYYPHFVGYAEETGAGAGAGFNLNLPLPHGADDAAFIAANQRLLAEAQRVGAEALVLSAGWDAHHLDPLSKLKVTTQAFATIGTLYGQCALPTVIVQEGGYSLPAIRDACRAFFTAYRAARGL